MQVAHTEYNKRFTAHLHEKTCVRVLTEELRNFVILQRVFRVSWGNAKIFTIFGKDTVHPSFRDWAIIFKTKTQKSKYSQFEETKACIAYGGLGTPGLEVLLQALSKLFLKQLRMGRETDKKNKKLLWSKVTTRELISYYSSTDQSASSLTEMSVTTLGASDKAHARPHWKVKWSDQAHIWF